MIHIHNSLHPPYGSNYSKKYMCVTRTSEVHMLSYVLEYKIQITNVIRRKCCNVSFGNSLRLSKQKKPILLSKHL